LNLALQVNPIDKDTTLIEKIVEGNENLISIAKDGGLLKENNTEKSLITAYNKNLSVSNYEDEVIKFDALARKKITKQEAESFVRDIYGTSKYLHKTFSTKKHKQDWKFFGNYSSIISFDVDNEEDYYLNSYSESGRGTSIMGITVGEPFSEVRKRRVYV
jgi:hypothetical protein